MGCVHDVRTWAQLAALQEYIDTILLVVIVQARPECVEIRLKLRVGPKLQRTAQRVALTVPGLDRRTGSHRLEHIAMGEEVLVTPRQPRVLFIDAVLPRPARGVATGEQRTEGVGIIGPAAHARIAAVDLVGQLAVAGLW